jgi:cell division protein FtsB
MWRVSNRTWNTAVGYFAAVAFAGITGFALGATFSAGCSLDPQNAPFGRAEFLLSRYQTLIAAAIAAIALFPVWRQVRLQGAQTDIARSAALRQRVEVISKARDDLEAEIKPLRGQLGVYPERIENINFWAHDTAQEVDRFLRFVSDQRALRLDGQRAAAARNDLTDEMERLSRALWVINWDVHPSEVDDLGEEEQIRLQAEAVDAEAKLEQTIDTALKMARNMSRASFEDIADARTELRALDEGLMSHGQ